MVGASNAVRVQPNVDSEREEDHVTDRSITVDGAVRSESVDGD